MSEAYKYLANKFGEEEAERLCIENPRRIFYGEALPVQPTPDDEIDEEKEPPPPRRGLFSFLRRR